MKPTRTIKKIALTLMLIVSFVYSSKAQVRASAKTSEDKIIAAGYTENDFQISPNPVGQEIKIRAPFNTDGGSVQIINEKGIEVYNGILKNGTIDASRFAAGMYLFVYTRDGNKIVKGFVKQ